MWPFYSHRQSPCWLIWRERRRNLFFLGDKSFTNPKTQDYLLHRNIYVPCICIQIANQRGIWNGDEILFFFPLLFLCFPWCIYPTVATGLRHTSAYVDWGYTTWPCPNCFPARSYYSRGNRIIISLGEQELWCHLLSDYSKSGLCSTTLAALTESNSFNE
jgi:hypothetical protein